VVSYRISLVVAIPLLVVLSGALVASNSYFSARANVRNLADPLRVKDGLPKQKDMPAEMGGSGVLIAE
jgi:hypothetical protein